jgi:dTDP-4-dehydrorhamnose 3,5-epimerase
MAPRFPQARATALPGCLELLPFRQEDARGWFLKTYHEPSFSELGLALDWQEEFVTRSHAGVVRGMHFQEPPHDQVKLVTCLSGKVLDVALDLRTDSPTYGQCAALELSGELGNAFYLPAGLAHGFLALEEGSTLLYRVSRAYAPEHDAGILWSSIPLAWPVDAPRVSERDQALPPLQTYASPFRS